MLTYIQSTGRLIEGDGVLWGIGYSGHGDGRNNPAAQHVRNVGPIPTGLYTMGDAYDDKGGKGPCVIPLTPNQSNNILGRSGFLIHGDNAGHDASHGCIIMGPVVRRRISKLEDRTLRVIAVPGVEST